MEPETNKKARSYRESNQESMPIQQIRFFFADEKSKIFQK